MDNGLKIKITFEISQIDRLLAENETLLNLCALRAPNYIEMSAAALMLHSFYNGIENMLISILKHYGEELPSGQKWHIELLDKAFVANGERKQIFRGQQQKQLEEYMKFRHFIRHSYGFMIEWTRMEDLAFDVKSVWQDIKDDVNMFIGN